MPWVASGVTQLCLLIFLPWFHFDFASWVSPGMKSPPKVAALFFFPRCFPSSAVDSRGQLSWMAACRDCQSDGFPQWWIQYPFRLVELALVAPLGTLEETQVSHRVSTLGVSSLWRRNGDTQLSGMAVDPTCSPCLLPSLHSFMSPLSGYILSQSGK